MASVGAVESQGYTTAEAQAFRVHYGRLLKAIQESELPSLGADLFSEFVISSELMELMANPATTRAVRSSKLLLAVMSHLEIHPEKFERVLKVFGQEPTLGSIMEDIVITHGDIKAKGGAPGNYDAAAGSNSVPSPLQQPIVDTSATLRYSAYLKRLYVRAKLPIKDKFSPSPCKKIIHLAAREKCEPLSSTLREEVLRSKSESPADELVQCTNVTPIELKDLLKTNDGSPPKCVIVQGVPGIGKSTFAWKACRKWGKGRLFQEYDLVVLLRMRDTYVREAKSLSDLFYSSDKKLSESVSQEVAERNGKGVLFVFEGLDELPPSILNDDNSILMELLQGILLPDITIVATARPWAVQRLQEKCGGQISRHIEILGFTEEDILRYISHSFSEEERVEFQRYLITQPHLRPIMYIPLNTAIVVQIYQQRKRSKQPLPVTRTQLYAALVQSLILAHLKCDSKHKDLKIKDLSSLPVPILEHFHHLCALAYSGFMKPSIQVVFNESELPDGADVLGLMQSTSDYFADTGCSVAYTFSHITIQEYLAAYHVSLQDSTAVLRFVQEHLSASLFTNVLLFLSGLTQYPKSVWNEVMPGNADMESLHLIYESQSMDVCRDALAANMIRFGSLEPLTLFDFHVLRYCISRSQGCWELTFALPDPSALSELPPYQCVENAGSTIGHTEPVSTIRTLYVITWNMTALMLTSFLNSIPEQCFRGVKDMRVRSFQTVEATYAPVDCSWQSCLSNSPLSKSTTLSLLSLESLDLEGVYLGDGGAVPILEALCARNTCITEIDLTETHIGCKDTFLLGKLMSSSRTLKTLNVAANSFSSESLQLLFSAVACAGSLKTLELSGNVMTPLDVEFLSNALSLNQHLHELDLSQCGIDAEGAAHFATGLSQNTSLKVLYLRHNKIEVAGAHALADMLKENSNLKMLDLCHDASIQTAGAESLILALDDNDTLDHLVLAEACEPHQSFLLHVDRTGSRVQFE